MTSREETVSFNVGGRIYEVRHSLLDMYPNTILARSASDEWKNEADSQPIFLDRDSERFRYCLDYMRDGNVELPPTESREAFIQELEYFGFDAVDPNKIVSGMLGIQAIKCLQLCKEKLDQTLKDLEERRNYAHAAYELLTKCQGCNSLNVKIKKSTRCCVPVLEKPFDLATFCNGNRMKPDLMNEFLKPYGLRCLSIKSDSKAYHIRLTLIERDGRCDSVCKKSWEHE